MEWRGYSTDEIEVQFNPRASVPSFEADQARHAAWSAAARAELDGHLDVAYGDGPLHKVDVFPAPGVKDAPVHVYLPRRLLARPGQGELRPRRADAGRRGHLHRDRELRPVPGGHPGRHGRIGAARASPGPGAMPATTAATRPG